MPESIHEKLKRVRKPRVHITYDVETEGAVVQKDLPFVVGVLGDFSGDPTDVDEIGATGQIPARHGMMRLSPGVTRCRCLGNG